MNVFKTHSVILPLTEEDVFVASSPPWTTPSIRTGLQTRPTVVLAYEGLYSLWHREHPQLTYRVATQLHPLRRLLEGIISDADSLTFEWGDPGLAHIEAASRAPGVFPERLQNLARYRAQRQADLTGGLTRNDLTIARTFINLAADGIPLRMVGGPIASFHMEHHPYAPKEPPPGIDPINLEHHGPTTTIHP